jgi:acyl-coenzyme A thioesterase PaaI-like protein
MLDVVVSVAAYAKLRQWLPTVEIKTSFLEPIGIGRCIGEGKVLKAGRSLAVIEGRLMTPDQRPAVTATATAAIPNPKS